MTDQHLDEGILQAHLDGELNGSDRDVRKHLAVCVDCRRRLEELREANAVFASAMQLLDPVTTAALREAMSPPPSTRRVRPVRAGMTLARAAGLVLFVSAAASATIPGSPVREWLEATFAGEASPIALERTEAPVPEATTASAPIQAGVTVAPDDGVVRIIGTRISPETQVTVQLIPGARAGVVATGDATAARFQSAAGMIRVMDVPGGELRVEIPQSTREASIVIDGRVRLEKSGDDVRVSGMARDSAAGAEIIFRPSP